jgi:hypothetical protein
MKSYRFLFLLMIFSAFFFAVSPSETQVSAQRPTTGKSKAAKQGSAIPKNWVYVYEKIKGYGFFVPVGTTVETNTTDGVDVLILQTPGDNPVDVFVLAYKDKTKTKADLLDDALEFLTALGQTVTTEPLRGESDNYAVADATTVLEDGTRGKVRVLVGTDVTDNYIMILGSDAKSFAANEPVIDLIWGSFEMWSGR